MYNAKVVSKLFFALIFICFSKLTFAQAAIKLGVWEVDNKLDCSETFTFLSDKQLLLESGDQIAGKAYKLKEYRKTGFYVFSQRTTSHNNQPNCAGSMGMKIDSRFKVYIRLNDAGDEMTFYTSPNMEDKIDIMAKKRKVDPALDEEEEIISDTPMEF